ncbi:CHAP domain-containing protein [Nocardioides sp. MAHUQ-72]|uniref:CHAP domain-containing protein n=1 Tax=unclassified Nocardioides TaxID=2615069 RepID=UPI0036231D11
MRIVWGVLRSRVRLVLVTLALVLSPLALPAAPANADYVSLCTGYSACKAAGYPNAGYAANASHMYWRMYGGHNCTNYAAYRMVKAGMPDTRPWSGSGNASNWGHAMAYLTDDTPMVGSIAWWDGGVYPVGSNGHVAYVEEVISDSEIIISDDNWGGDFHWHRVTRSRGWPSGFIHFRDVALRNKQAPTTTGTPQVGETLSATPGTWSAKPESYTYQWFADGQAISGATEQTFALGAGRLGQKISVQVAATAPGLAPAIATSAQTAAVAPGVITPVAEPVISGDPQVGSLLSVSKGSWDPGSTTKTVQWRADGKPIAGATGWSLELGQEQAGAVVTADVTASRKGYDPATVSSAPTESVLGGEVRLTAPFTLAGQPTLGVPVEVVPGTYQPAGASVTYTWLRDGVEIAGAHGPSYTPVEGDVGRQLSVRADLAQSGWKPVSQTTDPTAPVHSVPRLQVSVTGLRQRAEVLVAVTAPGVETVRGQVTVRVGAQTLTVRLRDGMRRVVVRDLHGGTKKYVVSYLGKGVVDAGSREGTVEILKKSG